MLKLETAIATISLILWTGASYALGDTQGIVSQVVTPPVSGGQHKLRIYFSTVHNDRYTCIQKQGYIETSDTASGMDAKALDRMTALALTALVTGSTLAIDSPGTDSCTNGNMAWLIKN